MKNPTDKLAAVAWHNYDVPPEQRFHAWQQRCQNIGDFYSYHPHRVPEEQFLAWSRAFFCNHAVAFHSRVSPSRRELSDSGLAVDPHWLWMFTSNDRSARLQSGRSSWSLGSGVIAVVSTDTPHAFVADRRVDSVGLYIQRQQLSCDDRPLGTGPERAWVVYRPELASLLHNSIPALLRTPLPHGDALSRHLVALGELVVQVVMHPDSRVAGTPVVLRRQAAVYIREHVRDSRLSAASVASALNVSPRALYRAFSDHDETVTQLIRRSRAEYAHVLLTNPANEIPSQQLLAHICGFGSIRTLTRTYEYYYGTTPKRLYQKALQDVRL